MSMNFINELFGNAPSDCSINEIFPFPISEMTYVKDDVRTILKRIITDTIERSQGISDKALKTLNDKVVGVNTDGLISILVDAIYNKSEVVIFYDRSIDVLKIADSKQAAKIREDYKKVGGESPDGIILNFKNFDMVNMLKVYSAIEYNSICSLFKVVNLSRALQVKISKMRESVALKDSKKFIEDARAIAIALSKGQGVVVDKEDEITVPQVDFAPTEKALKFCATKKAEITGMPSSYITGLQSDGLSSTGEGDDKAIEKGLRYYFFLIIKPVFKELFGDDLKFRSNNKEAVMASLEALKVFELIDNESLITLVEKRGVIENLLELRSGH